MFSPAPRLLWLTFFLIVPAFTIVGVKASAAWPAALFLLMVGGLVALDAVGLSKSISGVQIATESPVALYKDRPAHLKLVVQFPVGLSEAAFALDLPATFLPAEALRAKTSSNLSFSVTAQSRGEFAIKRAFLASVSRLKLWRIRIEKPISLTVKVFPDLSKDPAARKLFASQQQGQRVQRTIGRGREVERLRDYAAGDSFDEVYWKATARRGSPVSKVFQVERTQDIYAVLDGSRLGNRNQALERFVSASLLLALTAEKSGDNFGLLTFRNKVEQFIRASKGKGHFHRCREAIFDFLPTNVSPDFAELFSFISLHVRKRALLIFLTDLSDPLLSEMFLKDAVLLTRRHVVLLDQIADPSDRPLFSGTLPADEEEIQARLAGHLQWSQLRELEKALHRIGVQMQLSRPEQASRELLSQYRTIKQRQLL